MKVHAIQTGTVTIRPSQRQGIGTGYSRLLNTLIDRRWTEPLPILAWAIEHPEGIIVIDTGETSCTATPGYFPAWHPYFKNVRMSVHPEEEVGPQLKAVGLHPNDVRWVIMTHLHTDHAGGLRHFPNAEILVTRQEFELASGFGGQVRGFLPQRWPEWFSPTLVDLSADPFGAFPKSWRVTRAGDVTIVPTPGHTAAHVSVVVDDAGLRYFFAGDASYTQQLMLDQQVDGVAINARVALRTLGQIRQFVLASPTIYLPTHDPYSCDRLADRRRAPQRSALVQA